MDSGFQNLAIKIRDGTPLEADGILTYIKSPRNRSVWHFSSKLDVPSNVVHKKRVAWILVFKIWPSQEILKIRDGTPLKKKRVAWILVFKIWPSQEILKIRDGTPLEAERILTYIKSPRNRSVWHFYSKLDVPSNVLQKKKVARILVFKIWPSQEILKIRDGTPLEAEGILTYIKSPRNGSSGMDSCFQNLAIKIRDGTPLEADGILTYIKSPRNRSVWHFSSKLDVPSNVVHKKRVARILVFKIWPSKFVMADGILTYIKSPRNRSVWHFSSKLDVPSNVVHKKRVAWILVFKIWPSQEILKIRDDVPSNVSQKKIVAWILVFKIWPSQEILKIRDGTPLEAEGILTYIKSPRNRSVWHFYSKLDVPSNVLQNKKVARILVFKIWPSQEILKIRDGTPLEAEGILTYIKAHEMDRIKALEMDRMARILVFKIWPSQEILKIRDGTPLEAEGILTYIKKPSKQIGLALLYKLDVPSNVLRKNRVARILVFKIWPSQEILKIRDGTTLEEEGILTYIKSPRNRSVWHFSSKLDVPSNVVHKKRVAWILVFKIWPSQEILKIRDGTPLEWHGFWFSKFGHLKKFSKFVMVPLGGGRNFNIQIKAFEMDRFDTFIVSWMSLITYYRRIEWHGFWFSKFGHLKKFPKFVMVPLWRRKELDVPSNVVHKKRVAWILVFKIWTSQEILKIRDGTPFEAEGILTYIKKPSKQIEILKIRDGTPLEAEEIMTKKKIPQNGSVWHFSSKLDVPSNVSQNKRVARILVFKIWPSQEILKIRDGTPLEAVGILTYIKKPSKQIEEKSGGWNFNIHKSPRNRSVWHFSSKLDVPSNVLRKNRVAGILVFKIWPSQEIPKIRDGTPLEEEGSLTYIKSPRNRSVWHFSSKLDVPSNVVHKKRVAWILVFKIWPSQEILKIRDALSR
ncbi:hypothetical protein OROMI_004621 [Orobanche minor]